MHFLVVVKTRENLRLSVGLGQPVDHWNYLLQIEQSDINDYSVNSKYTRKSGKVFPYLTILLLL